MKYLPAIWYLLQGWQSWRSEEQGAGASEEAETLASTVPQANQSLGRSRQLQKGKDAFPKRKKYSPLEYFVPVVPFQPYRHTGWTSRNYRLLRKELNTKYKSAPAFTQDTMILLHSSLKVDRLHAKRFFFCFFLLLSHTQKFSSKPLTFKLSAKKCSSASQWLIFWKPCFWKVVFISGTWDCFLDTKHCGINN